MKDMFGTTSPLSISRKIKEKASFELRLAY